MQEEMHEQMSGYKRMRREHQGALVRVQTFHLFRIYGSFAEIFMLYCKSQCLKKFKKMFM